MQSLTYQEVNWFGESVFRKHRSTVYSFEAEFSTETVGFALPQGPMRGLLR